MGEGDVGKAGTSKTKLIAGIIVAVVVIAGLGAAIWLNLPDGGEVNSVLFLNLYFDTEYSDNQWIITIVNITTNTGKYYADPNVTLYRTINATDFMQDTDYISSIKDATSSFGMNWHDVENDNLLKVGDYLTINKNGGGDGMLDTNGYIEIITIYSFHSIIHLPPAEFLDMDIQKTSNGWNLTVTWVNETIPERFLEGWRVGFRIENESGAYGTFFGIGTGKIGLCVPLDMIESNCVAEPGTYNAHNMTYYYINWFDNDMDKKLSVNDSIVINHILRDGETLSFGLSSSQYGWGNGWGHVIFKVDII